MVDGEMRGDGPVEEGRGDSLPPPLASDPHKNRRGPKRKTLYDSTLNMLTNVP